MRIIIIGEFSSFAKNLSEGFRALGHECFVFSWGDGFKSIQQDKKYSYTINARFRGGNVFNYLGFIIHSLRERNKLVKYVEAMSKSQKWDVVLVLSEGFIKERRKFWNALFTKRMIFSLIKDPEMIFLSACGSDVPFFDYWKDKRWKNASMIGSLSQFGGKRKIRHHLYVISFVNKVIPVMYGYAEAWRNSKYTQHCQVLKTIPLPVSCSDIQQRNVINGKIIVFHGITRPKVKGTPFILAALEKLQNAYPNLVECKAEGGMALTDYLEVIDKTNIQIDQACCEYVGMNGLYGMAMGKVVVGGNEPENQKEYDEYDCPIINIEPDSDKIYGVLVELIKDKEKLKELSRQSRLYVERVHDSKIVAQKYLDLFSQCSRANANI